MFIFFEALLSVGYFSLTMVVIRYVAFFSYEILYVRAYIYNVIGDSGIDICEELQYKKDESYGSYLFGRNS